MAYSSDLLWTQSIWLEQVNCWIDQALHQHGIKRIGSIVQPHIRRWSTVLRVPTSAGDIYFKAVIPDLAYEASLTQTLSHWYPDCVPQILATDRQQGWLLMLDGGMRLRESLETTDDIQHWETLLPSYAKLQQESAQHVDELLELGVCDRRLSVLPIRFQELLRDGEALGLNHSNGLNSDEYQQLQNSVDVVARLCEKLSAFGVPETLHHGDLHDGNVFICDGYYRFFDWGDSSISHPFFSLHSIYDSLKRRFEMRNDSPWFGRLKVCYLQSWAEYDTKEKLEAAFDLAQQLSAIPSALRWLPVLSSMDAVTRSKYVEAIPDLMRELLSAIRSGNKKELS